MVEIKLIFVCMPKRTTKDGKISNTSFLNYKLSYNILKYCGPKIINYQTFIFTTQTLQKGVITSFQVIIFTCLNKLWKKMHSVFARYFSKLRNDKIVHNNYYRPCMTNRMILIILLGNCIFISKQRIPFQFQTGDIKKNNLI